MVKKEKNMGMETEKMKQLIFLSIDVSPSVVRTYIQTICMPLYGGKFQNFLNTYKHDLFHLHYNATPCCECRDGTPHIHRDKQIGKDQFMILYKSDGISLHEIKETTKAGTSYIKQYCLCRFKANSSLDILDLPLMWTLLRNCYKTQLNSNVKDWIGTLIDIRNFVCHTGSFNAYSVADIDTKLRDTEDAIINLASLVTSPDDMYKRSVIEKIKFTKTYTYPKDVTVVLQEMETNQDVNSQKIIDKIESFQKHFDQCIATAEEQNVHPINENASAIWEKEKHSEHGEVQSKKLKLGYLVGGQHLDNTSEQYVPDSQEKTIKWQQQPENTYCKDVYDTKEIPAKRSEISETWSYINSLENIPEEMSVANERLDFVIQNSESLMESIQKTIEQYQHSSERKFLEAIRRMKAQRYDDIRLLKINIKSLSSRYSLYKEATDKEIELLQMKREIKELKKRITELEKRS